MMKNTNHTDLSEYDHNREFAVILERVHTDVKTIADGQINLTKKADTLYEEFGRQKEKTTMIRDGIHFLKASQTSLGMDFKTLNNKFDVFSKDIKAIFLNHDKRLLLLETKITP